MRLKASRYSQQVDRWLTMFCGNIAQYRDIIVFIVCKDKIMFDNECIEIARDELPSQNCS